MVLAGRAGDCRCQFFDGLTTLKVPFCAGMRLLGKMGGLGKNHEKPFK
jgi:hypothetical protein